MIFLAREQMPSTSPSRIAQALSWLAGVYFSLMIMSSMLSTLLFFLLPYIPHYFSIKLWEGFSILRKSNFIMPKAWKVVVIISLIFAVLFDVCKG